jgi:hypothetical protein
MKFHLSEKSSNIKTGAIPVSTQSRESCPPSCAMWEMCYAAHGPLSWHWKKVTAGTRGDEFRDFIGKVRKVATPGRRWRYGQAGDLPGVGNRINSRQLFQLVRASGSSSGWTYTHKPCLGESATATRNREAVRKANERGGLTINLSGNHPAHADQLAELAIGPVVTVLPHDAPTRGNVTPSGRKIIVCPAQTHEGVTCASCGLCAVRNRSVIIGFLAHGTAKRKAAAIACQG